MNARGVLAELCRRPGTGAPRCGDKAIGHPLFAPESMTEF